MSSTSAAPKLASLQETSKIIGLTPKSIYNDLVDIRAGKVSPEKLPTFFYRPGSNRPIFVNVFDWVAEQIERQSQILGRSSSTPTAAPASLGRKRGRKTNKEKAAMARGDAA